MRLAGRPWRTLIETVRLGPRAYRVVRPAGPVGHIALYDGHTRLGGQCSVDKDAAADLATAWWLAARSRRSLVYLPLRSSDSTCGREYGGRRLDLVLLHHSLALPVSRWKEIRGRLRAGEVSTVRPTADGFPRFTRQEHRESLFADSRDRLDWRIATDTLFVVGSRRAFELDAEQLRALAEDAPATVAREPGAHCCAELGMGPWWRPGQRRSHYEVHVEYHEHR